MKKVLVIANLAANRGDARKSLGKLKQLIEKHHSNCCDYTIMLTERPGHAGQLASEHGPNYDLVAAFGGDGTVNETVQGLIETDTPLALIPVGTGNDFARSGNIPLKMKGALALICEGTPKACDVGHVNDRYFMNGVGIGFDGRANYEASEIKKLRGPLLILVAIFRTLRFWQAVPMTVEVDGIAHSATSYLIAVGNGNSIGGGLKLTPDADLTDGKIHVCHVGDLTRTKIIVNFPRLKSGTIGKLPEVEHYSGKHVIITSDDPLPVHVDGEVFGMDIKRLDIKVLPGKIQAYLGA